VITVLRKAFWAAGAPLRFLLVGVVRLYRVSLSGWLGGQCRFYPSCSHYAEESIRIHGALRGSLMAIWRVARCGPFTKGGVDAVRPRCPEHETYDAVLHSGTHS
jgi:uncharacterized protein